MIFGDLTIHFGITCGKYNINFKKNFKIFEINSQKFLRYFDENLLKLQK